jgi:hypothetical protein
VSAPVRRVTRESTDVWVGPIAVSVTLNGTPVTSGIEFALVEKGARPVTADWGAPVANPDVVAGGVGVVVNAVTAYGSWGVWVRVTAGSAHEVIEPDLVLWIIRT